MRRTFWGLRGTTLAAATLVTSAALTVQGCNGCNGEAGKTEPGKTEAKAETTPAAGAEPAPTPAAEPAPAGQEVKAAETEAPAYDGPSSRNEAGFQITSGFVDADGKPMSQPQALAATQFYLTVLDDGAHPIGALTPFADAEIHAFLVARDVRQAYYARGSGPIAVGADARSVTFAPREGGEHALVAIFQPKDGQVQAVTTPVVIRGNLPQVAGPGAAGLPRRLKRSDGDISLDVSPVQPLAEAEVVLKASTYKPGGEATGAMALPWAAICTESFASCEIVQGDPAGVLRWRPARPGNRLVLLPDAKGKTALVFGLAVMPAAPPEPGAAAPAAAPVAAPAAAPAAAAPAAAEPGAGGQP